MSTTSVAPPTPFVYEGVAYRQSVDAAAPWLISIVVPAEELLIWAGIPRRSDNHMVGFQRAYEDVRVQRAKEFFSIGPNQSPTALVVGVHPPSSGVKPRVQLDFLDEQEGGSVRRCKLTIQNDITNAPLEYVLEVIRQQIQMRLGNQLSATDEIDLVEGDAEANGIDQDDANGESEMPVLEAGVASSAGSETDDDSSEGASGQEIEIGRSQLQMLLKQLADPAWCSLNEDALRDIARPATLIDGQHRVKGAELCERQIPFSVCAIYNCPWSEQVFQFTVVNYTQKGIPDQFITANAALSLTTDELAILRDRLVQARVQVVEYELMKVVEFNDRSPFYNSVNLSESPSDAKIGYKTMVRIAKAWYSGQHNVLKQQLLPNLYPGIAGRNAQTKRLASWKEDDWGLFFLDFWHAVHAHFADAPSHVPGKTLWDVGSSQLIVAVVLLELQEQFFTNLNNQDEEFFQVPEGKVPADELRGKLSKRAAKFLEYFPPEFFATRWKLTSLSTGAGRAALRDALRNFVDSKGTYQYGKSVLVAGPTG